MSNQLYFGDNLDILHHHIKNDSVDLIYLDPPFNSKANYNLLFKEPTGKLSQAQITAFEDTWHWTEEAELALAEILSIAPESVSSMMTSFISFLGKNDVMAYLTMMCIRLVELRRVLKDTGSIFLHCDPTASHYLKILMDTIFGKLNFRNEIVWHYRRWTNVQNQFQRMHDIILFYSKTQNSIFNPLEGTISVSQQKKFERGYDSNVIHTGTKITRQLILYDEAKAKKAKVDFSKFDKIIKRSRPKAAFPDVIIMPTLNSQAKERLSYPTQKPEALLEILIESASDKGHVVLDPFCGCGTTISVAQRLNRSWIGIDITCLATNLIKRRMKNTFGLKAGKDYEVIGEPKDLSSAKELAEQNRYQFQWWALSLIHAKPYGDKKKGADTGIDGFLYFYEDKDTISKAIVQVKSGKVSVKDIRDLAGVLSREKAPMGLFITLEKPTKAMVKEAVSKGYYSSKHFKGKFPQIQILEIEQLFDGGEPKIPPISSIYKEAKRHIEDTQQSLEV